MFVSISFVVVIQLLSRVQLWDPINCSMPDFPVLHYHPEFAHTCPLSQWLHPTISSSVACFSSCPQSFCTSQSFPISRLFTLGAKVLELQLQHQSFQWIFRTDFLKEIDWLDLLAGEGTLKNLLPHHNLKKSILWCSVFFMVQLSNLYMTYWKSQSFD